MKLKHILFIAAAATGVVLQSCGKEQNVSGGIQAGQEKEVAEGNGVVEGIVAVKVSEELAGKLEKGLDNGTGIPSDRFTRIFEDAGEWEPLHRKAGLHLFYTIDLEGNQPVTKAVDDIGNLPGIVSSEEIRDVRANEVALPFNDPFAKNYQWHLYNDGSQGTCFTSGADIDVLPVWAKYTAGSSNVIVAVLDTGVGINNEDLSPVVIPMGSTGSKSFIADYSSNPYVNKPYGSHGSHVAGIIAAVNNNGYGVCGIAGGNDGNGGVKILDCQMMASDSDGKSMSAYTAKAIVWAADRGATLANNSWSSVYSSRDDVPTTTPAYYRAAIDYFCEYAGCDTNGNQRADSPMKGGLMFFAAGNDNWDRCQPAMYDKVIAVGACGPDYSKASYSNYGDWVDICAPGGAGNLGTNLAYIWSCSQTGQIGMCGTSQSCPMVTGAAALVLSYYGGQGFTADKLKEKLLGGANRDAEKYHSEHIGPLVDAYEAIMYGETVPPVPALEEIWSSSRTKGLSVLWKVQEYNSGVVPSYLAVISRNESDLVNLNPENIPATAISGTVSTSSKKAGATASVLFTGLDDFTFYYATVFGKSDRNTYSPQSPIIKVRTGENRNPVIETECPSSVDLNRREVLNYSFTASDADGDDISFKFSTASPSATWTMKSETSCELQLNAASDVPGSYSTTMTVTDQNGGSTSKTIAYTILNNKVPSIICPIQNTVIVKGQKMTLDLYKYFKDEDGDELTFTAKSDNSGIKSTVEGSTLTITAEDTGIGTITVTASDWDESSVEQSFKVLSTGSEGAILMYPNPVESNLLIAGGKTGTGDLKVYSPTGKLIFSKNITIDPFTHYSLDMSSCARGIYTVQIDMDGSTTVNKIAKQ